MGKLFISSSFLSVWLVTLILILGKSAAQDKAAITVNILLIYQELESEKLFDHAKSYIEKNKHLGVNIGEVHRFVSNSTDPIALSKDFCTKLDSFMASENKPDIAIDFTRIGVNSEAVKVLLRAVQMPTIAATFGQEGDVREWRDLQDPQKEYLIQVSPPADMLIQAVRSFVALQIMTSGVVLFDEQYEMYHKYKALLQNMPTRHLLTKLESGDKLTAQIARLVHVDIVNFFIASTPNAISEVLARASNPKAEDGPYFSDEFAWYSMSLEDGLPRCTGCQMDDVSVVHLSPEPFTDKKVETKKTFLQSALEVNSLSLTQIFYFDISLAAIIAVKQMKEAGKWEHDISNHSCLNWNATQNNRYPPISLDLFKAFQATVQDNIMGPYTLKENGKNHPNFKMKVQRLVFDKNTATPKTTQDIGIWNAGVGEQNLIQMKDGMSLNDHRANTVFRIVTVVQAPFVQRIKGCKEDSKYSNCFRGYCLDLLYKIKEDLQFNFTIREVKSGYGYMKDYPPHEWDGMVRELQDRKADIALGAMSVMAERESVVDFTVPYYDLVGISILMKKPKTPTSLFKFLTVLENDVWMCILGAYFFTSILMWIFDRWSPYSYQNNREKYEEDEEKREFNLKECLWFCMTSLTPQGGGEAPKNLSGRLVAATWWLFGFIIIASYTANLAAFLTVSRLDAPIESLDDLSKQYKVQYAPLENSSAWIYFDRMAHIEHKFYEIWKDMSLNDNLTDFERSQLAVWDYPVSDKFTKMWQAMQENTPPKTFKEAVDRVRGINSSDPKGTPDGFAFLDEATNIKWETTISCEFDQKGEEFSRKPYAIAVQKGSPLKESFSHIRYTVARETQKHVNVLTASYLIFCFLMYLCTYFFVWVRDDSGDATDIRYQVITSCDLQMVGEEFSRKPYALAVQQGSPLKDQLNDAILKLLNQRFLEQLKEEWWNDPRIKRRCPRDDNQSDGISIHNIGGVFIVIFVGIVMACFTLIFEYWWYRKRNVTEELAEMALPPPKEFAPSFDNTKTNYNTEYDKPPGALPSVENSW